MKHLLAGYSGDIFPVNPSAQSICGLRTYEDIRDLPEHIDLLISLIPAKPTASIVRRCAKGQVKVLLTIPSGFGEVPGGGDRLQEELISLARERHMRVVGPNSLGMLNCPFGLNASMVPETPTGGPGFSCTTQKEHRQILQRARIPCYHSTLSTVRTATAISHYATQFAASWE